MEGTTRGWPGLGCESCICGDATCNHINTCARPPSCPLSLFHKAFYCARSLAPSRNAKQRVAVRHAFMRLYMVRAMCLYSRFSMLVF